MKTLSRAELKKIQGGSGEGITCGTYHCICSRFHPEWEEWDGYYCDLETMAFDVMANCPDYGDGPLGNCTLVAS